MAESENLRRVFERLEREKAERMSRALRNAVAVHGGKTGSRFADPPHQPAPTQT